MIQKLTTIGENKQYEMCAILAGGKGIDCLS